MSFHVNLEVFIVIQAVSDSIVVTSSIFGNMV